MIMYYICTHVTTSYIDVVGVLQTNDEMQSTSRYYKFIILLLVVSDCLLSKWSLMNEMSITILRTIYNFTNQV